MRSFTRSRGIRAALGLAVAGLLGLADAALAREVTVAGSRMKNFGRIVLQFDATTKVKVTSSNSIVVIAFGEPARIRSERLASELEPYVSAVRRDPDGTGLRLALPRPFRTSVLEAGEKVFIDLLPEKWTGLPPSLPPEVVTELADRARLAEERLKKGAERKPPSPPPVRLQMAELPTLTRFVFSPPPGVEPRLRMSAGAAELAFAGAVRLDEAGSRPKLAAGIAAFDTVADETSLLLTIRPAPGYAAQGFAEGDTFVLEVTRPTTPIGPPTPTPTAATARLPAPRPEPAPDRPAAEARPTAEPARPVAAPAAEAAESRPRPPPVQDRAGPAGGTIVPVVESGPGGSSILFPFTHPTPAAAFERGGVMTLVFDTRDRLDESALDAGSPARPLASRSEDGLLVLRYDPSRLGPVGLVPEGSGWRLAAGGAPLPPDALKVVRSVDESGRDRVVVALDGASKVFWIADGDRARLAVVTALGRVQNLPLGRSFVEFNLPATLHGIVVEARADDLVVGPSEGAVAISRGGGLAVSRAARGLADGGPQAPLVLSRDPALARGIDAVVPRYQELVADAANAPRSGKGEARFRLARFLIGAGLNEEASSVLNLARREDQVFQSRRETSLLSGIAAVRAGRLGDARKLLAADAMGEDPEAALWRAVIDAEERRWSAALAGFRRAGEVLERYPDAVAAWLRLRILGAALGAGDHRKAEAELAAIDRLPTGSLSSDEHDLARARVDEAAGRAEAALRSYEKLGEEGGIRASAEARLRWTALASRRGLIDRDAAMAALEALSVVWRGGEIEIETIDELTRLYGEAARWRELFAMTRRANRYFPDHERTRSLHERSTHLLENLLLGEGGESLGAVQALSLYFDFKELAPVGRRGDEIVRRLADRLVELDLLDQASDLLQHQVDKRLTGVAKATVAARLAAIRLMSGKPLLALSVLQSSRLADLPADVRRFRFVLEARAQSDLARSDLALESIAGETGADFDRLRASILWSARRWREAGEAGEALIGTRWEGPQPLSDRERGDVMRAAIAYVAADERLALGRLKEKFGRKMLDSPDAASFGILMRPGAAATREFRTITQEATRTDAVKLLLADWSERRPEYRAEETRPPAPASPADTATVTDRRPPA